jgi:hypothetical protein
MTNRGTSGTQINTTAWMRSLSESFPCSYTIWKDTSTTPATIRAESNVAGGTDYNGAVVSTVIQAAIDALASGGSIFFRRGTYEVATQLSWTTDEITLVGEGINTEIKATAAITSIFNITAARYAHFEKLFINGNNNATTCIYGKRATSAVPMHTLKDCWVWGAITSNIDFTGCEDSVLINVYLDGRIAEAPATIYTEYGLRLGASGDGYITGGQISCYNLICGFHKYADIYAKNIVDLKLTNSTLVSKYSLSNSLLANLVVEGGTGAGAVYPAVQLFGCWMENDATAGLNKPNILVKTTQAAEISVYGGSYYNTDHNIYSALNPSAHTINVFGGHLECTAASYHVKAPCTKLTVMNPHLYGSTGDIDLANVTRFLTVDKESNQLKTNLEFLFYGNTIEDMKNWTDATLSGTAKLVEILIGGVPYYFKVYPTKT